VRLAGLTGLGIFLVGVIVAARGQTLAVHFWGEGYGWTSGECLAFGVYLICGIPKHVLFPLLAGIGLIKLVATSYVIEMILIVSVLGLKYPALGLPSLFWSLAGINAAVSAPLFVLGLRSHLKQSGGFA
jgi:hypothetical protein